jgi:DNA-directed RNA polymerase subunit RPC12/RpoP
MPTCGICGGEAPKQPEVTDDGRCDLCQRRIILEEDVGKTKCGLCGGEAPRQPSITAEGGCEFCGRKVVLRK